MADFCGFCVVAGGLGFEPRLAESESAVLPLDDPPAGAVVPQVSRAGRRRNLVRGGPGFKPVAPGAHVPSATRLDRAPKPDKIDDEARAAAGAGIAAGGVWPWETELANVDPEPDRPRVAVRVGDGETMLAALDLGTNNCRLLGARPSGDSFRVGDAFSRIVRLGEGVGACGSLSRAAMDRTIEALRICAGKMRRHRV